MNAPEYERIFGFEKEYWWHVSRRRLVRRLIDRYAGTLGPDQRYLDLGCGTGMMLSELGTRFEAPFGTDLSAEALSFARTRVPVALAQSDARDLPFPDSHFDLITCLDIIEHVRDDVACIRESLRVCKPGGYLVLSVPALDFLWGEHDEAVYHLRRYSWPSLKAKIGAGGFEVLKGTYAVMTLTPVVFLVRFLASFTRGNTEAQGHDFPKPPAWINRLLIGLHDVETSVSLRTGLPLGSGLVCIARKPETAPDDHGAGRT